MPDSENRISFEISGESSAQVLKRQLNQIEFGNDITHVEVVIESSTPFNVPEQEALGEETEEEEEVSETFTCDECGREFSSEDVLEYHIEMEHEEEEEEEEPEVPEPEPEEEEEPPEDVPRVIQSPAMETIDIEDIPDLDPEARPYIVLETLHQAAESVSGGESVEEVLYKVSQRQRQSLPDNAWMSTPEVRQNTDSDKIEDEKFATVLYQLNERGLATRRPKDDGDYEYSITLDGELAYQKANANLEERAQPA